LERGAFDVLGVRPDADWATIKRTYRELARRFHPDGLTPDQARMSEINRAYDALSRARRQPPQERPLVPVGPGRPERHGTPGSLLRRVQDAQAAASPVIDFGEYAGWRVADVARRDPNYLRWLSRHSSGVRYRRAIAEVLGESEIGRRGALLR
jgi:hypothetical protein